MLTSIVARDVPIKGPSHPVDYAILSALQTVPAMEPRQIFEAIAPWVDPETTLQLVHARLRVLVRRRCVLYRRIPGGPARGPGAGHYALPT